MMNSENDAGKDEQSKLQKAPITDAGFLHGRIVTNEDERRFLLKQLADAKRKKK